MEEELKELIAEMEERHLKYKNELPEEIYLSGLSDGRFQESKFIIEKLKIILTPSTQAGR